jgi:hypothetical protein
LSSNVTQPRQALIPRIFRSFTRRRAGDSAPINGVPEHAITRQIRHNSTVTLRKYIRAGALFRDNASARIGL